MTRYAVNISIVTFLLTSNCFATGMFMGNPTHAPKLKKEKIPTVTKEKATLVWIKKTFKIVDESIAQEIFETISTAPNSCPCPYIMKDNGKSQITCGGTSSYTKAGGTDVELCYPKDVLDRRKQATAKL